MNKRAAQNSFVMISTFIFFFILSAYIFGAYDVFGRKTPYQEAKVLCSSNIVDFTVNNPRFQSVGNGSGVLTLTLVNSGRHDIEEFYVQAYHGMTGTTKKFGGMDKGFSLDYEMDVPASKVKKIRVFPTILVEGLNKTYACTNSARERKVR